MNDYILVFCTVPDEKVGKTLAQALLEQRSAACVTISAAAQSYYWWQGKISCDQEYLLIIKSRSKLFSEIKKIILDLHPYEIPEIIAIPMVDGSAEYLEWITEETSPKKAK